MINPYNLYDSLTYDNIYYKFCDKDRNEMNLEGFSSFLMSSDNPIFAPEHAKVFQDMDQPLNHYFVDSSHNTYVNTLNCV